MTDNNALAQELEPCPFCGHEAELDRREGFRHYRTGQLLDQVSIYCTSCSANISHYPGDLDCDRDATAELCITAWNTRTPAPAPVGGDVVDAAGHTADAIRDQCRIVLGKVVSFDDSEKIANGIITHIQAIAALQSPPAPEQDAVEQIRNAFEEGYVAGCTDVQPHHFNGTVERAWEKSEVRAALAAMPPKVEAPAADSVRELEAFFQGFRSGERDGFFAGYDKGWTDTDRNPETAWKSYKPNTTDDRLPRPIEDEVRELVEQLRAQGRKIPYPGSYSWLCTKAADMLERLSHPTADAVAVERNLRGWLKWYRLATADDDCGYLNAIGWDDAEALASTTMGLLAAIRSGGAA